MLTLLQMTRKVSTSIWKGVRASVRRNASRGKYWIPVKIHNSPAAVRHFSKVTFYFIFFFNWYGIFLHAQNTAAVTTSDPASGNRLNSRFFNSNTVKLFLCLLYSCFWKKKKKSIFSWWNSRFASHPDSGWLLKWLEVGDVKHFFQLRWNQEKYERMVWNL